MSKDGFRGGRIKRREGEGEETGRGRDRAQKKESERASERARKTSTVLSYDVFLYFSKFSLVIIDFTCTSPMPSHSRKHASTHTHTHTHVMPAMTLKYPSACTLELVHLLHSGGRGGDIQTISVSLCLPGS